MSKELLNSTAHVEVTQETSNAIFAAAKAYSNAENKGLVKRAVLVDLLIGDAGATAGFQTQVADTEGKKGYSPVATAVRNGIVAGWGAKAVRLFNTPSKDLPPLGKFERNNMKRALGSRMDKLSDAIDARLNPVEKGPTPRKADDEWLRDAFNAIVKRVESSEGAGDLDLVEISEWLEKSPLRTFA